MAKTIRPSDINQIAKSIVDIAMGVIEDTPQVKERLNLKRRH